MTGYTMPKAEVLCREHDLLPAGGHVLCAVSGGADSVCLLHWLNAIREEFGFALTAAHYNHQLRGAQSLRDAEFVRSFVSRCCPGVELVMGCGDVAGQAKRDGTGIEETARTMRYAFLEQTAQQVGADVIAVAHNAEDNAETMLMHLMRGSGLRGMTGIRPKRGSIVRPFLTTRRREIEQYLCLYGLPHVEDGSNADDSFARNRVRHQLLPVLEEMQPQFIAHAGKTAQLLAMDEDYLTEQAAKALGPVETAANGLSVCAKTVAEQPDAIAVRMVRRLLEQMKQDGGTCTARHLLDVVELSRTEEPSAQISLPDGLLVRRVYDRLELVRESGADAWEEQFLPLPGTVTVPWGVLTAQCVAYQGQRQSELDLYLACGETDGALTIRPRRVGDRLSRSGRTGRTLKKILIDEKVPRHIRDLLPVLECEGEVAGVAGLGADVAFVPKDGEDCWHITCIPNTSYTKKGSYSHDGT